MKFDRQPGGLTLERHAGQSIKIGDDIFITVVSTSPSGCCLSIKAPKDIQIKRLEIAQ